MSDRFRTPDRIKLKFIFNVLVFATFLLLSTISLGIPLVRNAGLLRENAPEPAHPALQSSDFALAGSEKRGLMALEELHSHLGDPIATDGSEKRDLGDISARPPLQRIDPCGLNPDSSKP